MQVRNFQYSYNLHFNQFTVETLDDEPEEIPMNGKNFRFTLEWTDPTRMALPVMCMGLLAAMLCLIVFAAILLIITRGNS